jgi:TRAP-type C4-dicarboxylate transport system permease small subunit
VVVFFAVPLAQARRAHIRVEVVYSFMPRPLQFTADVLQFLLSTVFYALIAYFGWKAAMLSFAQGEYASGIMNFPIWPARFALCFGASLMTVQCAADLIGLLVGRRDTGPQDGEPAAPV